MAKFSFYTCSVPEQDENSITGKANRSVSKFLMYYTGMFDNTNLVRTRVCTVTTVVHNSSVPCTYVVRHTTFVSIQFATGTTRVSHRSIVFHWYPICLQQLT